MINLIVAPVIFPLVAAVFALLWRKPSLNRRLFFGLGFISFLYLAGIVLLEAIQKKVLVLPMGAWKAPYGILLSVDVLGAIMILLSSLVCCVCAIYSFVSESTEEENPYKLPLIFFLMAGINLSFSTGDFFNLFVSFEIMLIASYALLTLDITKKNLRFALPYLTINLIGSGLFLCAGGLFYSIFGTLNFANIAEVSAGMLGDPRLMILSVLLVLVFGLKAGFFPLYYWLPKSYPALPSPLAGIFAGLLTKVGIYAILRLLTTLFPHALTMPQTLILILAAPTMVFGILSAITQSNIRSVLCFNLVSHIGFMMLGIGIFTEASLTASIFYMMHHVVVMASLFLLTGVIIRLSGTDSLKEGGNIWQKTPVVGLLFFIQSFALIGIPPLSGFWGKLMLIQSGLSAGETFLVCALILASVLTLFSMVKVIYGCLWKDNPKVTLNLSDPYWRPMTAVAGILVVISLSIGLYPDPYIKIARQAASNSLNSKQFIEKVYAATHTKSLTVSEKKNTHEKEGH